MGASKIASAAAEPFNPATDAPRFGPALLNVLH